ncbi:MAG: inosine/xanthosine triphosphatase [Bacteroidetes bacterium]|nr:inosine/xanthosine triphosphatase [Bacteroidota bacterium]
MKDDKHIIVGSQNPVKVSATLNAFQRMFPEVNFQVEGIAVPSGISDQPMSSEETLLGAMNRLAAVKSAQPSADYWVGIEGGLEVTDEDMEAFAWIVVSNGELMGKGRSGSFFLPPQTQDLIRKGHELGTADDILHNLSNSKQEGGTVGILTEDVLGRTEYYEQAIILALIPLKQQGLYKL